MEKTYDIFISYSRKDSTTVHTYAQYLESLGYTVWYDIKGLYTGVVFSKAIATAIENSRLFIFFSSKNSNESDWAKGEVLTAKTYEKPILPIRIDQTEYDKSLMLVLLPLQYLDLKAKQHHDTFAALKKAVYKFIGKPSHTPKAPENGARHRHQLCTVLSIVASILLSLGMMYVSGEYWLNFSLSLFTMVITSVTCIVVSLYIINKEKNWDERATIVNLAFLFGIIFFLSYSMMAFGLCFISIDVFMLNSPSIVCAAIALYAFHQLLQYKKTGYWLLWVSACLFCIGSIWWLGSWYVPVVLAVIACACMTVFCYALKIKHNGHSFWERLI